VSRTRAVALAPAAALMALVFIAPMGILAAYSLLTRGAYGGTALPWTIENWTRLADSIYAAILWRSFWIAAVSTVICLMLGFPLALYITRAGRRKNLLLALVILPFWTSFLVRTYAWMFLLRDTGLINTALQAMGVTEAPLPLLYNHWAVILGLVYGYLPFMVLPLYATLERIDPHLMEAAADLGAGPLETLWRVVVPLARPGIAAGAVLVFIPCLGAYLTPDLLGGGKTVLAGNLIQNQFTTARDWTFGSAVSLALMAAVMMLLMLASRGKPEEQL
jgi:spermidine/putrescine transport system permease protein